MPSEIRPAADRPVENSELREIGPEMEQAIVDLERALTAPPVSDFHDQNVRAAARNALRSRIASLSAEISRLRADQITPEEAKAFIWWSEDNTPFTEEEHSAMLKLSRISEGTPQ